MPGQDDFKAESGARFSLRCAAGALCDLRAQAEDFFMSLVPPEVTRHLVNAQKEAIGAALRLGEMAQERLERKAQRAAELHGQPQSSSGKPEEG